MKSLFCDVTQCAGSLITWGQVRAFRKLGLAAALTLLPAVAGGQSSPPMPPKKTAQVYGQTVCYYEAGKGTPVILLHGIVGTATDWAATLGPLSRRFDVYALDQIGFGDSAKPLIEYDVETFVDFLAEFMRVKNIPKAAIVGNSMGGWIAADFAATHPGKVDRLVLVDAGGLDVPVRKNVPVNMNPASMEEMRRVLEFLFFDKNLVTNGMVRTAWERRLKGGDSFTIQRLVAALVAGTQFEDSKVGSIRARTLLIWGRNDEVVPLDFGNRYERAIPGAKLVVIDRCGHVPQMEKPAEFNKALMEFLSQP